MAGDKPNGKITNIEFQIMIDEMVRNLPYQIEAFKLNAKLIKARYDALKDEGFSEQEALEIVKARGTEY
ncbi:hypothetical protein [Cytobacillus firmus]|uniref:hypothetical protein n=1 Tax=Cytobacillus firmus TaxID=1399 RepID=UPI0018CC8B61|nr:hypothetical protein [Cytobacillus firmus]MBG9548404.1 hypothetical protein [Cytobacillus firmus]MBG9604504.1 hypothetical protein [Cytobacillus firmus]MED1942117.1 hypothetical protein [Cytobacillus firmus]